MSKETRDRHIEVVKELVKNPIIVLHELTLKKTAIMHAVFGVVGEVFEIKEAIRKRCPDNIKEEGGDLSFYLIDLRMALGLPIIHDVRFKYSIGDPIEIIEESTNHILDVCKKFIVYNREFSPERLTYVEDSICEIEQCLNSILRDNAITRNDVIRHNIDKLRDGPKARYKEGYSDKAAQERADKV